MDFHWLKFSFEVNLFNVLLFILFLIFLWLYGKRLTKKNMDLSKVTISVTGPVHEYTLDKDKEKQELKNEIERLKIEISELNKGFNIKLTTKEFFMLVVFILIVIVSGAFNKIKSKISTKKIEK